MEPPVGYNKDERKLSRLVIAQDVRSGKEDEIEIIFRLLSHFLLSLFFFQRKEKGEESEEEVLPSIQSYFLSLTCGIDG